MKEFELDQPVDTVSIFTQRKGNPGNPPVEIKSVPGLLGFIAAVACYVALVYYSYYYNTTSTRIY
jgi:hypothetical protein